MTEYVKREQIKKAINCSSDDLLFVGGKIYIDFEIVKKAVLDTPAADVAEVRHGYWKLSPDGLTPARCSECNADTPMKSDVNEFGDTEICHYESDYCQNCGARMDGSGESDA